MRGPGEKELETDRRIAQKKIGLLRKKLAIIERQSATQRKNRTQQFRVALVGYTNAGKSTLMQVLSKSAVHAENKLFATISSTVRKVVLQDLPFLLTDTVGFIRKLPHTLIECFKSTLDEVREADLLLHVVDVSHPAHQEHIQVVQETLQEIGAAAIPTILVLNKADQLQTTEAVDDPLDTAQPLHLDQVELPTVVVSAKEQSNIDTLKELIVQHIERQQKHTYPGLTHEKCAI